MNTVPFQEHSVVAKEESSSYLSRFWCLDNVGHHTGLAEDAIKDSKKLKKVLMETEEEEVSIDEVKDEQLKQLKRVTVEEVKNPTDEVKSEQPKQRKKRQGNKK